MGKTRQDIYKEVARDVISKALTDLEDKGFDTDNIDIVVKIINSEFDEEFVVS